MRKLQRPSRRRAVALRHVAFEDAGNLEEALRARGYRLEYREAGVDPLEAPGGGADLLIVLGGPIGAYQEDLYPFIRQEIALLERRLGAGLPTLGICLGAQLMARALGARVYPGHAKEIGWSRLALAPAARGSPLERLRSVPVLHWHGDTFDLPAGATHLASSERYPNQAFSWGNAGLALQFHAEVRDAALERWYIGHACEIATAGIAVGELRERAREHAAALQPRAAELWSEWLAALG